jgi:hypothetical protein
MTKSDIALWREFVIPLLTIVASGLVASIVTFKLNARLQRRDLLRVKLEEAYEASHEYCTGLGCHFMMYLRVFTGELDINEANALTTKNTGTEDAKWYRRLALLVDLYVPAAQSAFSAVLEARDRMSTLVGSYRQRYLAGDTQAPDLRLSLGKELENLEELEESIEDRHRYGGSTIVNS